MATRVVGSANLLATSLTRMHLNRSGEYYKLKTLTYKRRDCEEQGAELSIRDGGASSGAVNGRRSIESNGGRGPLWERASFLSNKPSLLLSVVGRGSC